MNTQIAEIKLQINKKIIGYKEKIEVQELRIENNASEIRKARSERKEDDVDFFMAERQTLNAQLQSYIQARVDFESLIEI